MTKRISQLLIIALVLWGGASCTAADIEPATAIRSVIVYPDGALIKKQAVFNLKKGQNTVRFSGITPNMLDDSVQAALEKGEGAVISDVKIEKTYLAGVNREKIGILKAKLENLEALVKADTNEIAVLNGSIDLLKKIMPFPQNRDVSTARIQEHVRYFENTLTDYYKKIARIDVRLKKLNEEKKAVEKELKESLSSPDESRSIIVHLSGRRDIGDAALSFSYIVKGAGWSPLYDVRAQSGVELVLNCFAVLRQSTGEDWKGVELEISTARPAVYASLPELVPWPVDIYSPRPMAAKSLRYKAKGAAMDSSKNLMLETDTEDKVGAPEIKAEATSFSFVLPGKTDVPADSQPHRIMIASERMKTAFNYYAVPKLSKYSYLKAVLKNPFGFPLLQGPMSIFIDGRLVASAAIDATRLPGEEVPLSLGIDEAIKAEKKLVRKFTEYAGAFTKETRVNYEYTIEITNGRDKEVVLTMKDNVPVSRNEKIRVELESPRASETTVSEDGIVSWNLKLAGREKKTIRLKYRVEYPRDVRITGLD